jgi:hypothetical protein
MSVEELCRFSRASAFLATNVLGQSNPSCR